MFKVYTENSDTEVESLKEIAKEKECSLRELISDIITTFIIRERIKDKKRLKDFINRPVPWGDSIYQRLPG